MGRLRRLELLLVVLVLVFVFVLVLDVVVLVLILILSILRRPLLARPHMPRERAMVTERAGAVPTPQPGGRRLLLHNSSFTRQPGGRLLLSLSLLLHRPGLLLRSCLLSMLHAVLDVLAFRSEAVLVCILPPEGRTAVLRLLA